MSTHQTLTDSIALAAHRARANSDDLFLHVAAFDELQDRLQSVNRTFTAPAVVNGYPEFWGRQMPNARCVPDTETLAIDQNAHDLVIHAMSLHWANDPVGQIIQCKRALRADGLFLAVCFGGETLHELRACLGQAEIEIMGGLSPRIAPMAELRDMGGLLQRAGLALPVADVTNFNVTFRDIWHLMHDLRGMGETNALRSRLQKPTSRKVFERANALYCETFPATGGGITATFDLLFLAGWAPDDSQPKPLRPGSAAQRLADALDTQENPLTD